MKRTILCFTTLSATVMCTPNKILQGTSFFSPRPPTTTLIRNIVGWHPYIHHTNHNTWYITTQVTPEMRTSFRSNRIAEALFGTETLFISGSQVENRGENDILADYFGLSPKFQSEVVLKPTIKNAIITTSIYAGLNSLLRGLYMIFHIPLVWTEWNFKLFETISNTGAQEPFPARYITTEEVQPSVFSFTSALTGAHTFGHMTQKMSFGTIRNTQKKCGLSDLFIALGYDLVSRERGYAGFYLALTAPVGNRPLAIHIFEPLIGNGKHVELGLGFAGRVLIWEKDGEQELSFFIDTAINHLFKARQTRSFDFEKNGFGSRYILVKEFDENQQYIGTLLPAINVTTLPCNVSIDIQGELLAMFGYHYKGFVFDIGYDGFLRSKERITLRRCIPERTYGIKGIQNVITDTDTLSPVTQHNATLHGNALSEQAAVADIDSSPRFITTRDLSLSSAASPMILTHKFFAHMGNAWQKNNDQSFIPFIGFGTSVEFEGINTSNTEKPNRNTLSQWAFWIKGGFSFS